MLLNESDAKKGETYMEDVEWILENLTDDERKRISQIFLSRVYTSFFVFEHTQTRPNAKLVLDTILNTRLKSYSQKAVFNITDFFNVDGVDIWGTFLFPFVKIKYPLFKWKTEKSDNQINSILDKFEGVFYRYLCVMEIEGKIVIFTDISEDFFDNSLDALEKEGYRKIELHNVIPKIIDSLSEKFKNREAEVGEMWVSFPLSMLGPHANIANKLKRGNEVSNDANFKNLIRYWLLDFVKINSDLDFNISFNSDNEKDKYRLPWYLYSKEYDMNVDILKSLSNFIKEIDKVAKEGGESNFAWLPIYVISGKRTYKDGGSYPIFSYAEKCDESWDLSTLNLILTPNEFNNSTDEYIITWIYPQYLKEWKYNDNDVYCYLKKIEDVNGWELVFENISNVFWVKKHLRCDDFLNEIRSSISDFYYYHNEEAPKNDWHNHPNLMPSDLFLTAVSGKETDKSDYLINITNPKRWNKHVGEKLWKKISVSTYKLSCFDFDLQSIKWIITSYHNGNEKIKPISLWVVEKLMPNIRDSDRFNVNWKFFFEIKLQCDDAKNDSSYYKLRNKKESQEWDVKESYKKQKKYGCPEKYKNKGYINNRLWFEDLWSLCFMELLEAKWHKVFFWGRTLWWKSRELADVISIYELNSVNNRKIVNINFFHMKLKPFEQKNTSVLESAFSHYTEVVWQVLEKAKSFLYTWRFESILEWLKQYFPDPNLPNYEIFEALKKVINENRNNSINFNIYFPIQEKDYFNSEWLDWNNLKKLWLETNWKRLKIITEVFNANISSVNPNMKVHLHLGLVICKEEKTYIDQHIKTRIALLHNVENLFK